MTELTPDRFTIDPTGTKKVILSVDGGGMRGAIPIAMLAELENQTGKKCQDIFDMVAGTSTGAIIAVGLAVGMTANDLLEKVYRNHLPKSFEEAGRIGFIAERLAEGLRLFGIEDNEFLARLVSHDLRFAYPLGPFLKELAPLVGSQTVGQLQRTDPRRPILFVTTKDMMTRQTCFIVNAGKGKDKFQDWPLPAVVACSGAAPVFFPPVENRFLDGGVGVYTNPCLGASIEAMEYIGAEGGFTPGNVVHVSLGTGYIESVPTVDEIENNNAIDWLRYVILENLNDGALQQVYANRAIYGDRGVNAAVMDFRRYNPLLSTDNVAQTLGIELQGKPNPSDLGLDSYQDAQVKLMVEIGQAYARKIDWRTSYAMPWDTEGGHRDPSKIEDIPIDWTGTAYSG